MSFSARGRPGDSEFDPYYGRYIARIESDDILEVLALQLPEVRHTLGGLGPEVAGHRYEPDKWTVKQVLGHVLDSERILATRALCIARGETQPLPGFDENAYAAASAVDVRPLGDVLGEFEHLRRANLALFEGLDDAAWQRIGHANGSPISVRAIAWILAGHLDHHLNVLRERYLRGER